MSAPDSASFRRTMGRWATGVTVVTVRAEEIDRGLTVNAFLSVSLRPPSVLVSIGHEADAAPALTRAGAFAVNLLAFDQRPLSERFGRAIPPEEKFAGLTLARGSTGAALLPDTLGALEAKVRFSADFADHRLFVGEVVAIHAGREVAPLVYFRSRYAESDGVRALTLEPPAPGPQP